MLATGDSLGPYRILSALGAGGMGEVYLAEDSRLRRRVAIKVLPPRLLADEDRRRRFLREARAAAAVDHPNIIHIYEVEEDAKEGIYLVMQHVDGRTLRQAMQAGGLDLEKSLGVAMEVADALAAAHAQGIVHRDIKPDNIMLDAGGHVRILDFGLARALEAGGAPSPLTEMKTADRNVTAPGAVMGTVAYMSPEQARGMEVDARSDIFSFGVTLYEMVAGRHPFVGRTGIETMDSLLNRDPKPVSQILPASPPAMEWVLSKMLAKNREERYQSAKEVLVDLRKLRHSTLGASTTAAVPAAARAAPGPGRLALIAGALVAVAAVVALAVWKGRAPSIEKPPSPPATPVPATGAIPAASAAPMKIAVLPLQNVRKDPRIDFLGFALADALISKLSYLNSVAVRPSSYVQKYRDAAPEPKQVGAELGVDHLLLGTLLAEGDTLRISVQLVDLGSDSVRWQDMFDARLDNLLGVQDTIVNRLVAGMKVTLTPAESTLLKRDESRDPEAFDLLLRATALPVTEEGTRKAIELLQASLKKDPSFAPTWEALAERQYGSAEYLSGGPGDYEAAAQSRRRALDINPDLPEALFSFGTNLVETGDHEQAYRWFHGRLSTNPSDARAHFLLSYLYRYTGMLRESAEEAERALALDSRNRLFRSGARTFFYLGEIDRAAPFLALDPDTTWTFANRIEGEVIRGDLAKARSWGEKCIAADPNSILADRCRAFLLIIEGDTAAAVRLTRPQFERVVPDVELLYNAAALRSWMGEVEPALDLLDRAVKGGFFPYTYFEIDPRLKALRSQPRYASIRDEAHRRSDAFRSFVAANP